MAPCPRCGRENPPTAAACTGCRTPLAFSDELAPGRLDVDLDLDRRQRGREEPDPPSPPAKAPPFDPDAEAEPAGPFSPEARPASPVRRLSAWSVDCALVAAAAFGLPAVLLASSGAFQAAGSLTGALLAGLPIVIPTDAFVAIAAFVYATVSHALAGATLGKRLAGIRVVGPDGRPPGIARSATRSAWLIVSIAAAGLGLLPALFAPSRRALHDLLAGTRVVEGRDPTPPW